MPAVLNVQARRVHTSEAGKSVSAVTVECVTLEDAVPEAHRQPSIGADLQQEPLIAPQQERAQ